MSTKRFYFIGFAALIVFDTVTQVFFKLATQHTGPFEANTGWLFGIINNGWIFGAMLGYVLAFFTWMTLLKHAPVGPAFAASHLEVVTVLAVSVAYFGEHLSLLQVLGAICIVSGIICLSLSESKHGDV